MADYTGTVVVNYRLTEKLGEGGFGVVYLAEHEALGRKAAVKILHPEYARRQELVDRFFREARAVCAIAHKAIIDVHNFGSLDSGEPYYVMEYFPGQTLAEWVEQRGPMSPSQLAPVFAPVARALTAAHATGVIHRDLKPENVMIAEGEGGALEVKLLDFGIAKLLDASASGHSRTGLTMGTPAFMSPEQSRDAKSVDARADVYSFGATIYFALAGRPPFVADNITDLIVAVATAEPESVRAHARGISPELDAALARCLSKDPARRFESVEAAWNAVEAGARAAPATTGPQPPMAAAATMPATPTPTPTPVSAAVSASAPAAAPARSKRMPVFAMLSMVALAAGGLIVVGLVKGGDSETAGGSDAVGRSGPDGDKAAGVELEPDAAVLAPPIDATAAVDAAPPIDAPRRKPPEHNSPPDSPPDTPTRQQLRAAVEAAMRGGSLREGFAACDKLQGGAMIRKCLVLACRNGNKAHARRYLKRIRNRAVRERIRNLCVAQGISL